MLQQKANLTAAESALGGLSFQIGEGTQDLIKTKTINSNVAGLKLHLLLQKLQEVVRKMSAGATAGTTGIFTRTG